MRHGEKASEKKGPDFDASSNFHEKHSIPLSFGDTIIAFQFKQMCIANYPELSNHIKHYVLSSTPPEKSMFSSWGNLQVFLAQQKNYIIGITQNLDFILVEESSVETSQDAFTKAHLMDQQNLMMKNQSAFSDDTSQISGSTRAVQFNRAQLHQRILESNQTKELLKINLRNIDSSLFGQQFIHLNEACFGVSHQSKYSSNDATAPKDHNFYTSNTQHSNLLFLGSSQGALCVFDWTVSPLSIFFNSQTLKIVFYGLVDSDEINEIAYLREDIFFSTSLDGSITFYSVSLQDVIATVNLEVTLRSAVYNHTQRTLIVLAASNFIFLLRHSEPIYNPKTSGAELKFNVVKSFEITKQKIDKLFTEGSFLYMYDKYGLIHKMDIDDMCLMDMEMTPQQLAKKDQNLKRRTRGNFPCLHKGLRGAALEHAKSPDYVDLSLIVSRYVAQEEPIKIEGYDAKLILIITHNNQGFLVDKETCKRQKLNPISDSLVQLKDVLEGHSFGFRNLQRTNEHYRVCCSDGAVLSWNFEEIQNKFNPRNIMGFIELYSMRSEVYSKVTAKKKGGKAKKSAAANNLKLIEKLNQENKEDLKLKQSELVPMQETRQVAQKSRPSKGKAKQMRVDPIENQVPDVPQIQQMQEEEKMIPEDFQQKSKGKDAQPRVKRATKA